MIKSKADYLYYLRCDKKALNKTTKRPRFKHDIIWKFQILLRKCEYLENCKTGLFWQLISKIYKLRYVILSQKLGFSMGFNTFGPGLSIAHYGALVINNNARVGVNCRIHEGVTIGVSDDSYFTGGEPEAAPKIGNNVFIATGAKIIGNVTIADGVAIGANAVVVKDISEPNITVGGVPAKKISDNGSDKYVIKAAEIL